MRDPVVQLMVSQALQKLRQIESELVQLLSLPARSEAADDWLPIDSAPKDGTRILLCQAIDADGHAIVWGDDDQESGQCFVQVAAWWGDEDGWVVYCSLPSEPRLHFEPTHWMPLPNPPKLSQEGAK